MSQLCELIEPYICPNCGEKMMFFETGSNTLIDYKSLIYGTGMCLPEIKQYLSKKNITDLYCMSCNKRYIIDWSNSYPAPLTDLDIINSFGML